MTASENQIVVYQPDETVRLDVRKKVNVLFSRHLDEATIDTDPSRFRNWDCRSFIPMIGKFWYNMQTRERREEKNRRQ